MGRDGRGGISGIKMWHFKVESRPISISILIVHCIKYPLKNGQSDISQYCDTSSTCQSVCVFVCAHVVCVVHVCVVYVCVVYVCVVYVCV